MTEEAYGIWESSGVNATLNGVYIEEVTITANNKQDLMRAAKLNWPTTTPIPDVDIPEDEPKFEKVYIAPLRIRTFVMKFMPYEKDTDMADKFMKFLMD